MRRARSTLRAAALLVCALSAVLTGVGPASAAARVAPDTVVEQPFAADSGDSCRYGYTKGVLGWHLGPLVGRPTVVEVAGTVLDRPLSGSPAGSCGNDGRYATVTLTAYVGTKPVDTAAARVDNGTRDFRFQLANTTTAARIDRIVIEVCRPSLLDGRTAYCGPKQEYRAPVN